MVRSWFSVFIFLAAAIELTYFKHFYLAFFLILFLLIIFLYVNKYSSLALTGLIVLIAGLLYVNLIIVDYTKNLPIINNATVSGKVISYPKYDEEKISFILSTRRDKAYQEKLQVFCHFQSDIKKGDRLEIKGNLKPPNKPGNPGEFDYASYLAHNHIYYLLAVEDRNNLRVVSREGAINSWINTYRIKGEKLINSVLPRQEAAVLLGMLLGQKENIESKQYSDFQKTGIVHIFAVSGLHVGFLLLLSVWFCSFFSLSRRSKFLIGISLMLVYGTIVGWPISVTRATIMATLGLLAYYMGRENTLLNSMGLAGTIILLIDPLALFKISFQLSFMATWGLIYLFPLIRKNLGYQSRILDLALIPFCAQIAVLPLIAFHFNLFTPVSILSNIIITYLAGAVVIMGFVAFIFSALVPLIASFFLYPAGLIIELILLIADFLPDLPGSFLWVATPGFIMIFIYYCGLLVITCSLTGVIKKRFIVPGMLIMMIFIVYISIPAGIINRGIMEVVFIDVGQGDGILLKTPEGKFILIDGGGSDFSDVGSRKVLPYLHHRGIRHLFMVINTHPDTDHLAGLEKVVEEIPAKYIGIPASLFQSERYQNLKQLANAKAIPIVPLSSGQEINIEKDTEIIIMYPPGEECITEEFNDQSIVLQGQYNKFSFLLTGDLENQGLHNLMGNRDIGSVTLVKVPHHGSKGSLLPEFYEKSHPDIAVISVGSNNFGHPHTAVINELTDRNIRILRTDKQGAITVSSDGNKLKIETFHEDR
jgi:competence protein ComEC